MADFFTRLKKKLESFSKTQKILLVITVFLIFFSLAFFLVQKPPSEGPPEVTAPSLIKKITRFFGGDVGVKVTPTPPKKTFTAKEIAQITISYLDSQKRPDGFYYFFAHYEDRCQDPSDLSTCPLGERNVVEQSNMWTILARLSFYQNFSESPKDLIRAEADAESLINFCQKDYRKCLAAVASLVRLYQETNKDQYKQFLEILGGVLLSETYGQDVMALGGQARDLALLYELFGREAYLRVAKERLKEAEALSEAHQHRYGSSKEVCYIVAAQTEIGRVANDQETVQKAVKFFREGKEKEVLGQLTLIQPCIEAALELGNHLNDTSIKSQGEGLLEEYVTKRWDGPGLGRMYQEGGFFLGSDKHQVDVTDTGYMLYLLGFLPDKSYSFSYGE